MINRDMIIFRKALAFLKRSFITEKNYRLSFFVNIFNIVATITMFYFMAKLFGHGQNVSLERYKGDIFTFLLIGLIHVRLLHTWLNSFSESLQSEFYNGTLEIMLISRTGIFEILFFSVLWNFVYAVIHVLVYLAIGTLFFKADVSCAGFMPASIIILISTFTFSGAGIILASLSTVFKKGATLRHLIFLTSTIFGGVYFPVEILPGLLQNISYILPITHTLKAMREVLINGHPIGFVYREIIILIIFASVLFPMSLYIFKKAFRRAKIEGSLTHY